MVSNSEGFEQTTARPTQQSDDAQQVRTSGDRSLRVMFCGSELLFAEALAALLARRGMKVVGCAASLDEFVQVATAADVDACLIDVSEPADAEAVRYCKQVLPELPILVLAPETDRSLFTEALAAGADGICLRTDRIEEVERMLLRVDDERGVESRSTVWSHGASSWARRRHSAPRGTRLTPKEQAVLDLLILGTSTPGIAEELDVREATVRTHLQHLFAKFGVHNRIALIAAAVQANGTYGTRKTVAP